MAMTPDEIREQSFPSVRKGGLDPEAVADFLTNIADEVVRLQDEVAGAQEALASATPNEVSPPEPSPAPEPTRMLVGPRVDELLEAAQRSADGIVSDAEDWATGHRADADTYAQGVRSEVDELRQTTETQAESFRQETVEYANRIREDAEAATAQARSQAETDLNEQYDRLTADVSTRVEKVQTSEQELLVQLNVTKSALDSAASHFQAAVDAHTEPTITRGSQEGSESWAPTPETMEEVPAAGEETAEDGPQWPPSAEDSHKPVDQWESTTDESGVSAAAEESHVDPWGDEAAAEPWVPAEESNGESSSPTDWSPAGSAEPWQADQSTPEQPRTVAADDRWAGPSDEGRSSFFTKPDEANVSSVDNDPLSTMVREAVERVTDGQGNN